jgi:hypothetical protein
MATKIINSSDTDAYGVLYGADLLTGGQDREYRNIVRLKNNTSEDESNTNEYIKVIKSNTIYTNSVCIAFWVYLEQTSSPSSGIVLNRSITDDNLSGVVINANEQSLEIGTNWNTSESGEDYSFFVKLNKETWHCVVVNFYPSGISRLFVDNVYSGSHDIGFTRPFVNFDNIEIGRFCGMIDNVMFYSDTLDYGNVSVGERVTSEVSYFYHEGRTEQTSVYLEESQRQPITNDEYLRYNGGLDYYYRQPDEFVSAFKNYADYTLDKINMGFTEKEAFDMQNTEQQEMQKFKIEGGSNVGVRKIANGKFRKIKGRIIST